MPVKAILRAALLFFPLLGVTMAAPTPALADGGVTYRSAAIAPKNSWTVMAGTSLRHTLQSWAERGGWRLVWDSEVDYTIRASATFAGNFEVAAARLVDAVYNENPELVAVFHMGNQVLLIDSDPLTTN